MILRERERERERESEGEVHTMDAALSGVLPNGMTVQQGPANHEPNTYDDDFVLPAHCVKPLQQLNTHPLDAHLTFYEVEHVYTFDGVPTETSVTSLAHEFEEAFVAQRAIDGMKTSRAQAWPRLEYAVDARAWDDAGATWHVGRGALATCHGRTVAALPPHCMAFGTTPEALAELLRRAARAHRAVDEDDLTFFTYERALDDAEIVERWRRDGLRASHMGTDRHYLAECFFNGLPHRWWEPDMAVLYDFCRHHLLPRGIVAHNTEKEIVCRDANVAGSIDLIVWDAAHGVHHIIDFKRSSKLRTQLRGYGKMRPPFKHLDDCKGAGYAIQVSIYQYILERDYGMRIGDRILLSLHADEPFETSVPYMREEVRYIMERRFARVRAQRAAMAAHPERFTCRLTGAPAVEAMRHADDGSVAMGRAVRLRNLDGYVVDAALRAEFARETDARTDVIACDASACTSWRRLMPEGGIPVLSKN